MPKADGSIIIDTRLDTGGFDKGCGNLKNQFGDLGSSIKKLGGIIAAAFSVRAITNFAKEAIETLLLRGIPKSQSTSLR